MLHKTIRFPNNKQVYTANAVLSEHLQPHVQYNSKFRSGQSIFVDDVCVYHSAYHSDEDIAEMMEMSKSIPMPEHCMPYN